MAETEGSPFGGCLEKLSSYVRTRKGTILAAEIVSYQHQCVFNFTFHKMLAKRLEI